MGRKVENPTMYAKLPHEELLFRAGQIRIELSRRARACYSRDSKVGKAIDLMTAAGAHEDTAEFTLDTAAATNDPDLAVRVAQAIANKRWLEANGVIDEVAS